MNHNNHTSTPPNRKKRRWLGAIVVIVAALALIKGEGTERYLIVGGLIFLIGALLLRIERLEARKANRETKPPSGNRNI